MHYLYIALYQRIRANWLMKLSVSSDSRASTITGKRLLLLRPGVTLTLNRWPQPNKHGRPASLTTTQTDSAMIRGNGTSSNIRSANTKRRASTSKARKQVGVFITRLTRSTNPKDLATHVKWETGLSVSCEPLRTKFDTYSSFCVKLPPRDQHLLLVLWSVLSLNKCMFETQIALFLANIQSYNT